MKKARLNFQKISRTAVALCALAVLAGCKSIPTSMPPAIQDFGPSYKPANVYRRAPVLPVEVRRVALLPLTATGNSDDFISGIETLEPVVYSELQKTERFEVIPVTREQLKQWTGKGGWRADEPLPHDLFEKVAQATGCNAVFFCQLTRYQPYPPLAVGWKLGLVQNPKDSEIPEEFRAQTIWAVDENLDSGDPTVTTGARLYYSQHLRNDAASSDAANILSSPTRFGQYTLATLLATLPERSEKPH